MTNLEKYKDEILHEYDTQCFRVEHNNFFKILNDIYFEHKFNQPISEETVDVPTLVNWFCEEYKEPILNKKEKEYLSNVIRPFRERIISIAKLEDYYDDNSPFESIEIKTNTPIKEYGVDYVSLPYFVKNTMYKEMELNKEYTLKELGL